jgi:hypothetical protein
VRPAALLAALLLAASAAEALDVDLEVYRAARRSGALGAVAGGVLAEPRTPRGAAPPLTGTTVALLPRSEAVLLRLEQLKARSRDSSTAFTAAVPGMHTTREMYERALWEAGAPDLTTMVLVDAAGGFRIDEVPAGAWLVIAWHSVAMDVAGEKVKSKSRQRETFRPQPRLRGFQSVTIWLRPVIVTGGTTTSVELTDRNGWFRGVIEERLLDPVR